MANKKPNKTEYATKEDVKEILLEFADKTLLPGISAMMDRAVAKVSYDLKSYTDQRVAASTYELKSYVDDKLADQTAEIFGRLEKRDQNNGAFKKTVVTIFKREKIGTKQEIGSLERAVSRV